MYPALGIKGAAERNPGNYFVIIDPIPYDNIAGLMRRPVIPELFGPVTGQRMV
jgi:hypothetical protein